MKDIKGLKSNTLNISRKYSLFLIIFLIILVSCNKKELKPLKYVQWVDNEKNGLSIEKEYDELTFNIQYQPLEYVILRQSKNPNINKEQYDEIKSEVEGLLYFNFIIEMIEGQKSPLYHNITSPVEYQNRVSYLSFQVPNDLKLVIAKDTLPCVLHHFERTYDIMPKITLILGFEKPSDFTEDNLKRDMIFIYDDKIFGVGKTQIKIDNKKLRRIPKLKIFTYATED